MFRKPVIFLAGLLLSQVLSASEPMQVMVSISSSPSRLSPTPVITNLLEKKSIDKPQLRREVKKHSNEKWLIYIHGFSSSAKDSLERAKAIAQNGQFNLLLLDWPGGKFYWSWLPGYIHRRYVDAGESGEKLAPLVRELFWSLGSNALQVLELNVVAHSMGGEVSRKILKAVPEGIHEVVLVAPCTYARDFETELQDINSKVLRVTSYSSTIDKVLAAGHFGNQGSVDDSRSLGTLYRHRDSYDYDLINVTCQYSGSTISNLFYAHFPGTTAFREDVQDVLRHNSAEERKGLAWVQFHDRSPLKGEVFSSQFWNLGSPDCPKAKKGTMKIVSRLQAP